MKTIKFWDIPNKLKNSHLTFDGDQTDLRLFAEQQFRWGAKTKTNYKKAEKKINQLEHKGNGFTIYCWCDISGFEYWMKTMEKTNYIQITISFDTVDVLESELENIENALIDFESECLELENEYDFDPNVYE